MAIRDQLSDNNADQLAGAPSKIDWDGGDIDFGPGTEYPVARGFRCRSISGADGTVSFIDRMGIAQETDIVRGETVGFQIIGLRASGSTASGIEVLF